MPLLIHRYTVGSLCIDPYSTYSWVYPIWIGAKSCLTWSYGWFHPYLVHTQSSMSCHFDFRTSKLMIHNNGLLSFQIGIGQRHHIILWEFRLRKSILVFLAQSSLLALHHRSSWSGLSGSFPRFFEVNCAVWFALTRASMLFSMTLLYTFSNSHPRFTVQKERL